MQCDRAKGEGVVIAYFVGGASDSLINQHSFSQI